MDFQKEKELVLSFYEALTSTSTDNLPKVMEKFCDKDLLWHGFHPFDEIRGAQAVGERFWCPLKTSLKCMTHRMDIFMAGRNRLDKSENDGETWVASMGHLMGLFDQAWLGIQPTSRLGFLPYAAFHKLENEKIRETALFFDIPHLMIQAGLRPFPPQTATYLLQPGPATHDGLLFSAQPEQEGDQTIQIINRMIGDLGNWQMGLPLEEELARTWHKDMLWWGPSGIGATFTIERYAKQHSRLFRSSFKNRSSTNHICRLSEGHFGGFFGWPNFTACHTGGFMGMPGSEKTGEFRVIDIYRRENQKLKENWVFIDTLHFWYQQGVDILSRTTDISNPLP